MSDQPGVTLGDIEQAEAALKGVIHNTFLERSSTFSDLSGCQVYLKLENMQKTGSFKIRGAYNKIRLLTQEQKQKGVIAASAGNHAQGVAFAAQQAGIKATVVMPEVAPLAKVIATRGYGAEVVLHGLGYDDAYGKALEIQRTTGQIFVHAFDDEAVIAGQGTVGLEIIKELEDVECLVVPVGGGGLIAGIAVAVKTLAPHIKVYGVQARGAAAVYQSIQEHSVHPISEAFTMADGIAVKVPGSKPFKIIDRYVDDIFLVDDDAIATAILMLLERSKFMVEGAGAVSLAAVLNGKVPAKGRVVTVISGGNIDVNVISRLIERGLVDSGRRVKISTTIFDRPGELQKLLTLIAKARGNLNTVYHDRVEHHVPIGQTVVELSLETRDSMHTEEILSILRSHGYIVTII
ncbi:MAG: tdcB 1 [Firmicutes bacterium]|nr:tdcB 1 [Bacillota bacterium]